MAMKKTDREALNKVAGEWLAARIVLQQVTGWPEADAAALLARLAKRGYEIAKIPE